MSMFDIHEPPEIEDGPLPPPDFAPNVRHLPRMHREHPAITESREEFSWPWWLGVVFVVVCCVIGWCLTTGVRP